jgi:thiamine-phosphate pyrophosphorylase
MVDLAAAFVAGGARFLQVRGKQLASGEFLQVSRAIAAIVHERGGIVIVNDRADIARLAGADGVHLGQQDLSPSAARRILGPDALIGCSTHTAAQIEEAAHQPIGYLAIGPVFGTRTKRTGYEPVGVSMVRQAAQTRLPVVAIGGITLESAPSVIEAGASAVAIISDLLASNDPAGRVREYTSRLERI